MIDGTKNQKEFIKELGNLTRKYKIRIYGCGCCGSPSLEQIDEDEGEGYVYTYGSELRWERECDR
jgi:hypothetical protein